MSIKPENFPAPSNKSACDFIRVQNTSNNSATQKCLINIWKIKYSSPMASIVCLENEWFKEWIVPCSLSSHQSNQRWLIVKEKLIMNFDKSFTFFYLAKCFSKTHLWLSVIFFCNQRQRLHYHRGNHRAELPGVRGGVGEGLKVLPRIQTNSREFNHTDHGYAFRITGPVWGNPLVIGGFPSQRTNNAELWCLCGVSPKKMLNKHSISRWSEALCRSYNITSMTAVCWIWRNICTVI